MKRMSLFLILLMTSGIALADPQPIKQLVGDVAVGDVDASKQIIVPSILWGGDAPLHKANGGVTTTPDSIFGRLGLNIKIVPGDDPLKQTKDYVSGKSAFVRLTMRMSGIVSESLHTNPKIKPRMLFQETYSLGDHMIFREKEDNLERQSDGSLKVKSVTTINDLKGTTGCIQAEGPHVGLVDDTLRAASLTWADINIKWAKDITGPNGPLEMMKKDPSIDWVCLVTPDMLAACITPDGVGTGAEGTIKGGRVINTTATMSRSIVDGYYVREDFYQANKDWLQKFVAGYHKALEQMKQEQAAYQDGAGNSPKYVALLDQLIAFYGEDALPAGHDDAHGLILDAAFVGLPGNESFFNDPGNLNGFDAKQKAALDLANSLGYTQGRYGFQKPDWDYKKLAQLAGLTYVAPTMSKGRIKAESLSFDDEIIDQNKIMTITINFDVGQEDFPIDTYYAEFKQLAENSSLFGRGTFVIRGHSDTTHTLFNWIKAAMKTGDLTRTGESTRRGGSGYKYFLRGKPIDFKDGSLMTSLVEEIEKQNYGNVPYNENPRNIINEARALSKRRAEKVKERFAELAQREGWKIDMTQIQPQGVGIRSPVIPKPSSREEAAKNRRVEFVLMKVEAEALTEESFDY